MVWGVVCTFAVNGLGPVTLQKTPLRKPELALVFPLAAVVLLVVMVTLFCCSFHLS